jgi:hypothetical protein
VVAVHANAHYTYIFDGTAKLFCPLPISDVEARLDTSRFLRVHRSHIVNIERVRRLKRAGDSGMVELEAADPIAGQPQPGRLAKVANRSEAERNRSPINLNSGSIADAVRANEPLFVRRFPASCTRACRRSAHIATLDLL